MKDRNTANIIEGKCRLCDKPTNKLIDSHIIPSFVGKWLKETSVTGYLRQPHNANLRAQDIMKIKLLCKDCEVALSIDEKLFSQNIFIPYVTKELDEWAVARGDIKYFEYDKWLTNFVIGLQWKALITHPDLSDISYLDDCTKEAYSYKIKSTLKSWSKYLLGESSYAGSSNHYIIFLQNLIAGKGTLPDRISDKVNMYLIRSVDTTLALSQKSVYLYTKLGPIVIISTLLPKKINGITGGSIKNKGIVLTAQHLKNKQVNEFIFITRPNEAYSDYSLSDKQKQIIDTDVRRKIGNAKSIQTVLISRSDMLLSKRLNKDLDNK